MCENPACDDLLDRFYVGVHEAIVTWFVQHMQVSTMICLQVRFVQCQYGHSQPAAEVQHWATPSFSE
jgi:hypothetical protein